MRRVNRDQRVRVALTLNGRRVAAETEPRTLLRDFLRHSLAATGTHVGCEHGICGCCTVMIDGAAVRSCLTLAMQAEGKDIRTVESLAGSDGSTDEPRWRRWPRARIGPAPAGEAPTADARRWPRPLPPSQSVSSRPVRPIVSIPCANTDG